MVSMRFIYVNDEVLKMCNNLIISKKGKKDYEYCYFPNNFARKIHRHPKKKLKEIYHSFLGEKMRILKKHAHMLINLA